MRIQRLFGKGWKVTMAKATLEIVPAPPKPKVFLELSFEEAQAVHLLLGKLWGTGEVREYTYAVYRALNDVLGVDILPRSTVSGTLQLI
jgi:hypothetical protein